jgi:hypothetical protein
MRVQFLKFLALAVLLAGAGWSPAQDEARAIIERAVKAHGGADKLGRVKGQITKTKGKLELLGGADFTQESAVQYPNKFREVMHLSVMGNEVDVTTVYNGKEGWLNVMGMTRPLEGATLDAVKDAIDTMALSRLAIMGGKDLKLSLLGESMVNGKPVLGVKVSREGRKDVNMYFDKGTGLLAKLEHRVKDPQGGQDVAEERIILEYQDVDGMKVAKKAQINRDDKKFMDVVVEDVKFADKLDDVLFEKP